jgi:trans-aconitate 2-methyltransferase
MADWSGEQYAGISALQKWLAEESLSRLRLTGRERVLDLGCGDGKISAQIASLLPEGEVMAVDVSPLMVDYGRHHHGLPNLRFDTGDARRYRCSLAFDWVVSFNALHWVAEMEQPLAFATVRAALKSGGQAHLRLVGAGPIPSLEESIEEVRRLPAWREAFEGFAQPYCHPTVEQCRSWASAQGLELLHSQLDLKEWDFGSRQQFEQWSLATFVNWTGNLPEADRPRFVGDVLDRYSSPRVFRFYQLQLELKAH